VLPGIRLEQEATDARQNGFRQQFLAFTKASISMPGPAITQAMIAPNAPVACPNGAGNAKMPEPTIDPITRAMSALRESF